MPLLLLVFFSSLSYPNQNQSLIAEVLINVKALKFERAREILKKREGYTNTENLKYLTELISVHTYRDDNRKQLAEFFPSKNSKLESLNLLIQGYENLFLENNRVSALSTFNLGIETAVKESQTEILKALLIGVFTVKLSGYSVAEDSYEKYLQLFKDSISDNTDYFWFHYYTIIYLDMTSRYGVRNNDERELLYKGHLDKMAMNLKKDSSRLRFFLFKELGDLELGINDKKALEYFTKCENLLEDILYFDVYRFRVKLDKSISHAKMGKSKEAIQILKKNRELVNKGNLMTNRLNFNFFLSEFYKENGQVDSAFFHLKKLFKLTLESNHNNINEKVSALEVELDTAEKEKQILVEQQRATKNRNWLIAASLALLLGTGIAILLQKNTIKKRQLAEQIALLEKQKVETLLKEQELVSIDAMIAGQEKERQKVAGELHDDLGSLMATIKLHFDNAKVSKTDPALQNAQKLLEEAYQKIRGMAHHKNSGVMSDQGLLPAIKKMARTISETNALKVIVEDFGMGDRMENSLELSIFRMIQELVANAIKHAEASQVTIQLTQHEENLNIIVEDNGKGFDRADMDTDSKGMGLTTIEKRVEHLEGNFTIDSVLGKGTSILIDIPV